MTIYEKRHVLFCDILGFSQAVLNQEMEPEKFLIAFSHLQAAVQEANRLMSPEQCGQDGKQKYDYLVTPRAEHFSDCLVISVPATNVDAIWLCQAAAEIQNMLVRRGFLSRGAICTGPLHHSTASVFGPAFVQAVNREKSTVQPRIEVSEETLKFFRQANDAEDEEICRIREAQLLVFDDNKLWIDPFHNLKFFATHESAPDNKDIVLTVDAWRKVLMRGLQIKCAKVRKKYIWMSRRFNLSLCQRSGWISEIQTPKRSLRNSKLRRKNETISKKRTDAK